MTRECTADFKKIEKYINDFKISENLNEEEYKSSLKVMHKCYFAAITWNAEILHKKGAFLKLEGGGSEDIIIRLSEVVSDLGSSLFNWANGNYKASRIMLRVAIENFIRAISGVELKSQLIEMNVYKLFENASKQNIFKSHKTVSICYDNLHSDYKLLCEDAHTATKQNMEHLSSLADLPTFEKIKSAKASKVFVRITRNFSTIFCILFNDFYHQMHHRNRENILYSLKKEIKPIVSAPNG